MKKIYIDFKKEKGHEHQWRLIKESTKLLTNIRTYKCKCGTITQTYSMVGSDDEEIL
jgi:hypothetical protein